MRIELKETIGMFMLIIAGFGLIVWGVGEFLTYKTECQAKGGAVTRGVIGLACVKGVSYE